MRSLHPFTASAAVALLLLAGGLSDQASAQAPAPVPASAPVPTHLAVINIVKVFAGLEEKNAGDREIEDLAKQITNDRRKKEDNLKALSEGLNNGPFKADSPDFKKQQDEVIQASMDLQVFLAVSEQRLLLMQRIKTESVYRSMNAAIKKYAEGHSIAIVFVADDADFSGAKDTRELTSRIAMRKIIYAHPSYDITKDITEQMNAEYHPTAK